MGQRDGASSPHTARPPSVVACLQLCLKVRIDTVTILVSCFILLRKLVPCFVMMTSQSQPGVPDLPGLVFSDVATM